MKKRVISAVISAVLVTGVGVQAFATPLTDEQKQQIEAESQNLNKAQQELQDIESKLTTLNSQVEQATNEVSENETKMEETQKEIDNADEEIETIKEEILEKEEILGSRLNAIYKSGGVGSYLDILFESNGLSDFLTRVQALNKIVELDRDAIIEVDSKKQQLDDRITKLTKDKEDIKIITEENIKKLKELEGKKTEMQKAVDEYEAKVNSADVNLYERESVMYQYWASIVNNSNSSVENLNTAINTLQGLKSQVKSEKSKTEIDKLISKAKSTISSKNATINRGDSGSVSGGSSNSTPNYNGGSATGTAANLLSYAYKFLGKPYVYGATGPNAFDCSGFTGYVFRSVGISLPRVTYTQANVGRAVSKSELQPGDLVFTEISSRGPEHVGIYVGNGQMIHAANPRQGVIVGPMYNYGFARRVL